MKKLYTTILTALVAMTASAQQPADSTYVRIDFNLNPWNLPVSIPNRDQPGGSGNWALVEDETGCFEDTHVFDWEVSDGQTIQLELTPSNWKLTDYMNAMVYTHNFNEADEPFETMLWMRRGSQLTFKAPEGYWFAKVALDVYRNWSGGSLYSGDETGGLYVWGKDSVKSRPWPSTGELLPCWEGDSIEWSLPENTGNTFLRFIDVWLLPRNGATAVTPLHTTDSRQGDVFSIDGVLLRRDGRLEGLRKGLYIVNGKVRIKD